MYNPSNLIFSEIELTVAFAGYIVYHFIAVCCIPSNSPSIFRFRQRKL